MNFSALHEQLCDLFATLEPAVMEAFPQADNPMSAHLDFLYPFVAQHYGNPYGAQRGVEYAVDAEVMPMELVEGQTPLRMPSARTVTGLERSLATGWHWALLTLSEMHPDAEMSIEDIGKAFGDLMAKVGSIRARLSRSQSTVSTQTIVTIDGQEFLCKVYLSTVPKC